MQPTSLSTATETDFLPLNSVDWHFLLPFPPESKVLVVGRNIADTLKYFTEIGIKSFGWDYEPPFLSEIPFPESDFDVLAVPQGFVFEGFSHNSTLFREFLSRARRLLKPGGSILLGFENFLAPRHKIVTRGFFASPGFIHSLLISAGFEHVRLYGVMSNLSTPDYIFPLDPQSVSFVLSQKFRHKLPAFILRLLGISPVSALLAGCLPNYFALGSLSLPD